MPREAACPEPQAQISRNGVGREPSGLAFGSVALERELPAASRCRSEIWA